MWKMFLINHQLNFEFLVCLVTCATMLVSFQYPNQLAVNSIIHANRREERGSWFKASASLCQKHEQENALWNPEGVTWTSVSWGLFRQAEGALGTNPSPPARHQRATSCPCISGDSHAHFLYMWYLCTCVHIDTSCVYTLYADKTSRGRIKSCQLENWVAGRDETHHIPFSPFSVLDHVSLLEGAGNRVSWSGGLATGGGGPRKLNDRWWAERAWGVARQILSFLGGGEQGKSPDRNWCRTELRHSRYKCS